MDCTDSDILVIGGGPAGSTVATLLSEKGWQVTLLERDTHPRFHIGESLLPGNMEIFERLGVSDRIQEFGVVKHGAAFARAQEGAYEVYDFARATHLRHQAAFQVRRSELDHLLLRNAAAKGVTTVEGVTAHSADIECADGVRVRTRDETGRESDWTARFLIDASGRGTFLANKLRLKVKNPRHNTAAVFAHFTGAERGSGREAGNIRVYWFDKGWFWFIPLTNGVTSVGVVCGPNHLKTRGTSNQEFLLDCIHYCPPLARRLRKAEQIMEARATGNFSYHSSRMSGRNFLLVGDAYGFIDPVFSSGVFLAMFSGQSGAASVDAGLRNPRRMRSALRRHERLMRKGMKRISWFIYAFTDPAFQDLFMNPRNTFKIRDSVISLLAGDLFYRHRLSFPLFGFKVVFHLSRLLNQFHRRPSTTLP